MISDERQNATTVANMALASQNLGRAGLSTLGIAQLLNGQPVSGATDRAIVTKIILAASQGHGLAFWPRVGQEVLL